MANWGRVKLCKMLFYIDFEAYKRLGKSITEATYIRMPQGPVPKEIFNTLRHLEGTKKLGELERQIGDHIERRPTALAKPKISEFTPEEIAIVEQMIAKLGPLTAQEVSDLSHGEVGWRLAAPNEEIPYFTAFSGDRSLTKDELDYARKMISA